MSRSLHVPIVEDDPESMELLHAFRQLPGMVTKPVDPAWLLGALRAFAAAPEGARAAAVHFQDAPGGAGR